MKEAEKSEGVKATAVDIVESGREVVRDDSGNKEEANECRASVGTEDDNPLTHISVGPEADDNVLAIAGMRGLDLPCVAEKHTDNTEFIEAVRAVKTLGKARVWADNSEKGYLWEGQVLEA